MRVVFSLGVASLPVVKHTLQNTSQLVKTVEAEQRELMRDHRVTWLAPLRPHCINDVRFSDMSFSTLSSVRRYTMFQLFSLLEYKVDKIYLMRRKLQAHEKFSDFVRETGAPNHMVKDHSEELMGSDWLKVARRARIDTFLTEPHHQNTNLAERCGGSFKDALQTLFLNTPWAPLKYW